MKRTGDFSRKALVVACALLWPGVALAYIDAGTGAMLVQGLLALVAAVIFYLRNPAVLWGDFKGLLRRVTARMLGKQPRAVDDEAPAVDGERK
jgi:hypothetical protein